jgi:hypothetical protein
MREVDVALRSQVGSVDILVIIECRDRKRRQDVTWIEQLASKRKDVGADRAVTVSANGFSKGAWNLARAEHIDFRLFEEVDEDGVLSWLELQTVAHRVRRVEVIRVAIATAEEPSGIIPTKDLPRSKGSGETVAHIKVTRYSYARQTVPWCLLTTSGSQRRT